MNDSNRQDTRRLVVTGGLGYVGQHVTALLARAGHDVLVVDDLSLGALDNLPAELRSEVRLSQLDVRDAERLRGVVAEHAPDVVLHLAALHFIPACERDPRRAIRVNVEGTEAVLEASRGAAGAVVVASTAAVYEPSLEAHSETSTVAPTDIYGLTKLWTENLAALFGRRTGTPVGVARLFNVFGPGETNPHLIPEIIRQLEAGDRLRLGNLSTKRDYVYVDDVARALQALAERVASGGGDLTCNVGTGHQWDGEHVVAAIGRLLGREVRLEVDPSRMRKSDRPSLLCDPSLAGRELGWSAQVGLEEGLALAIERPVAKGITWT
jgi:UDP-glucose 4-epimerase